jgi:cytoskeleton protein RodZ
MTNNKNLEELGRKLKDARGLRGLSITQVATDLNLLDAYINGLESGDHSLIKSDVFVRGYLRTYGNYLKLDVDELLAQYGAEAKSAEVVEEPDQDSSGNAIYVLLAIIIAGLLIWTIWPVAESEIAVSKPILVPQQVKIEKTPVIADTEESKDNSIETPLLDVTGLTIEAPIVAQTNNTITLDNELLLRFVGECWIEVRDKAGRLLLADLKNAGDEVTLTGEPPYKVVIGNTTAIEVFYAGKLVDVLGSGESNTAKLVIGE